MNEQQNPICLENKSGAQAKTRWLRRGIRNVALLVAIGGVSLAAGFETARTTLSAQKWGNGLPAQRPSRAVSPVRMPTPEENKLDAELNRLPPQQRAERLLERAMHDDAAALDLLRQNVDGWRGHIRNTDQLFDLVLAALNSRDLRVRTAAIDVDLAANNLSKSPESVAQLIRQLQRDPTSRGMALWRLGALGDALRRRARRGWSEPPNSGSAEGCNRVCSRASAGRIFSARRISHLLQRGLAQRWAKGAADRFVGWIRAAEERVD